MDQMHVRVLEGKNEVEVSFFFPDKQLSTMMRAKSELMSQTVKRMAKSFEKRMLPKSVSKSRGKGMGKGAGGGGQHQEGAKASSSQQQQQAAQRSVSFGRLQMIEVEVVDGKTGAVVDLGAATNEAGWRSGYQVRVLYAKAERGGAKKHSQEGSSAPEGTQVQVGMDRMARGPKELRLAHQPHLGPLSDDSRDVMALPIKQGAGQEGGGGGDHDALALLYHVVVNPPAITDSCFHTRQTMLCGYPVMPLLEHEFTDGVSYRWFREEAGRDGKGAEWKPVGEDAPIYCPEEKDQGCRLKVLCTPYRHDDGVRGRTVSCYASGVVQEGPVPQMEAIRLPNGQKRLPRTEPSLTRICCYNILADMYATSDYALAQLYDYLAPQYLASDYRCQVTLRELQAYNTDIMCLQEVDQRVFDNFLRPHLELDGFVGHFKGKCGSTPEGCATFVRRDRFEIAEDLSFNMRDAMAAPTSEFAGLMEACPNLEEMAKHKLTTIAQVLLLRRLDPSSSCLGGGLVLLANTHLFFHPHAAHIRLLQARTLFKALHDKQRALREEAAEDPVLVICGDLNSHPGSGAMRLLCGEAITPTDHVWDRLTTFKWGNKRVSDEGGGKDAAADEEEEEEEEGLIEVGVEERDVDAEEDQQGGCGPRPSVVVTVKEDSHDPPPLPRTSSMDPAIASVIPTLHNPTPLASMAGFPDFTNFVRGFVETLDYVMVEAGRADVARVADMPDRETASRHTALPSPVFPSDHVSILVDVRWNDTRGGQAATGPEDG